MNNLVDIKITGKNPKRFIMSLAKNKYNIYHIEHFLNFSIITISYKDYKRLSSLKTIYKIEVLRLRGLIKIKYFLYKYRIFFTSIFIGLILLYLLSNIILTIDVETSNNSIKTFILEELEKNNISKYKFGKGFYQNKAIRDTILKNNKDKIEWMNIERVGTKYIVEVELRKTNDLNTDNTPRNIVASKKGIIKSITSSNGEVIKKINDYVNKGDIIISGIIKNKDEVKDNIRANGKVIAETWYNVTVEIPNHYKESTKTGKERLVISFDFLNKELSTSSYKNKERTNIFVLNNLLLPIKLGIFKEKELNVEDNIYTYDQALIKGINLAKDKLNETLKEEDKIIYEKCLKLYEKDSKIILEVFIKVQEDITAYQNIDLSIVEGSD